MKTKEIEQEKITNSFVKMRDSDLNHQFDYRDRDYFQAGYDLGLQQSHPTKELPTEEMISIPKWQFKHIEDVLRQTSNQFHSQTKETCFDRCVCKAWDFAKAALNNEIPHKK